MSYLLCSGFIDLIFLNFYDAAKLCIQKSLLLLNFLPVRAKGKDLASDVWEAQDQEDIKQYHNDKRQRTSSIVEADFQASGSLSSCGVVHPASEDSDTKVKHVPDMPQIEANTAFQKKSLENTASQQEDASSPPSTPTRKPQFSRGRLRLLSFRSVEEPKSLPTVKEKYPILKNILDFIKDQSLSHER